MSQKTVKKSGGEGLSVVLTANNKWLSSFLINLFYLLIDASNILTQEQQFTHILFNHTILSLSVALIFTVSNNSYLNNYLGDGRTNLLNLFKISPNAIFNACVIILESSCLRYT